MDRLASERCCLQRQDARRLEVRGSRTEHPPAGSLPALVADMRINRHYNSSCFSNSVLLVVDLSLARVLMLPEDPQMGCVCIIVGFPASSCAVAVCSAQSSVEASVVLAPICLL